jgi:nitrogen fixation-related uncharacterized protein
VTTTTKKITFTRWFLLVTVGLLAFFVWAGNTGRFNDPNIVYAGRSAQTGQWTAVRGCRPERLLADGSCDRSFRWDEFFGNR